MKYKYVLWDWNGTLLDDLQMNIQLGNDLIAQNGLGFVMSKEFYLENFGFPIIDFYKLIGFDFKKTSYEDMAVLYAREYGKRLGTVGLFPQAENILKSLCEAGIKNVMISATEHNMLLSQIEYFKIGKYFDSILGTSDNLGSSKVQTAVDWLQENGADAKNVVFIGDTTHDAQTARAIGCSCILIPNGHNSRKRLEAVGCKVVSSLDDLKKELLAQ